MEVKIISFLLRAVQKTSTKIKLAGKVPAPKKPIRILFFLKVFIILFITILALVVINFDRLSQIFPARYRPVFEKVNDIIFGKVQIIEIYGNSVISKDEILTHIYRNDVLKDDLITINQTHKIKKTLSGHSMVRDVNIRRFLPNKMVIYIKEKGLILKFYDKKKQRFLSVTESGEILPFYDASVKIPLLLGDYQAQSFLSLHKKLAEFPVILQQTTDIIPFFNFRYDIILNRKLKVSLPEENISEVLSDLERLIKINRVTEKNIKHIDFRATGKIFIEYFKEKEANIYYPQEKMTTLKFD